MPSMEGPIMPLGQPQQSYATPTAVSSMGQKQPHAYGPLQQGFNEPLYVPAQPGEVIPSLQGASSVGSFQSHYNPAMSQTVSYGQKAQSASNVALDSGAVPVQFTGYIKPIVPNMRNRAPMNAGAPSKAPESSVGLASQMLGEY